MEMCFIVLSSCIKTFVFIEPHSFALTTVKLLNLRTPENFAVYYLKYKKGGQTIESFVQKMQMEY